MGGNLQMEYNAAVFCILSIITVFIISGNCITIGIIVRTQRLQNVTGYLMVSLAAADIGVGLTTAIPLIHYTFSDQLDPRVCDSVGFMNSVTWVVSVFTLVALSLDRYISIAYPLQCNDIFTNKRCAIMVCSVWGLSTVLWVIPLFGYGGYQFSINEVACYFDVAKYPTQWIIYNAVIFVPSSSFITVIYFKIWRISHRHSQQISDTVGANNLANEGFKRNRKAVMTLLIIVLAFYIAWLPFIVEHIFKATLGSLKHLPIWLEILIHVMALSNSFWNPIIYMGTNKVFRHSAFDLCRSCCPCIFGKVSVTPQMNQTN